MQIFFFFNVLHYISEKPNSRQIDQATTVTMTKKLKQKACIFNNLHSKTEIHFKVRKLVYNSWFHLIKSIQIVWIK